MPQLPDLSSLVEKLKLVDNAVIISTTSAGDLLFKVETSIVQFETKFSKLKVINSLSQGSTQDSNEDTQSSVDVAVDLKMLSRILQCHQVGAKHAVCGILPTVMILQIVAGDAEELKMTYYIPTLIQDD